MDIARPSNAKQKQIRQGIYAGVGLLAVVLVSVGLSRLKPAAPTVERAVVWPDTVKRGPMVRQVRASARWCRKTSAGFRRRRGARREDLLRPGTTVKADSVILELTNPQLEQELQDAQLKLQAAEAALANLRVQLQNDLLTSSAPPAASIEADYNKAQDAGRDERGACEGSARVATRAAAVAARRRPARDPQRHREGAARHAGRVDHARSSPSSSRRRSGARDAAAEATADATS